MVGTSSEGGGRPSCHNTLWGGDPHTVLLGGEKNVQHGTWQECTAMKMERQGEPEWENIECIARRVERQRDAE